MFFMTRVVAIDYGIKRCGIAVSDPFRIIANAYKVVSPEKIIEELEKIVREKEIDTIVVGYPINNRGEKTSITVLIDRFMEKLIQTFPKIKIEKYDERLTSKMAKQTLIFTQTKKTERQKKSNIDLIAATILLQNYLDYCQN